MMSFYLCAGSTYASLSEIFALRMLIVFNKQTNNNDLLEKDGGTKNCIYKD